MISKYSKGLAGLGAGISMLIGLGISEGVGIATAAAVESVARQPETFNSIKEILILGIKYDLVPLIAAFIISAFCYGLQNAIL